MRFRQIVGAAALAGICMLSVPAAVAYRTDSDTADNRFTFTGEKGLNAVLTEPSWRPEKGLLVIPDTVIAKDPQITNTSHSDLDELVAVRLEFRYSATCPDPQKRGRLLEQADMEQVNAVFSIDYSADQFGKWVRYQGEDAADPVQHFYYKEVLERNYPNQGETTEALFTKLSVEPKTGNLRYARIQQMGGFDMILSGAVLQFIPMESQYGLTSARQAYEAGLFVFPSLEETTYH